MFPRSLGRVPGSRMLALTGLLVLLASSTRAAGIPKLLQGILSNADDFGRIMSRHVDDLAPGITRARAASGSSKSASSRLLRASATGNPAAARVAGRAPARAPAAAPVPPDAPSSIPAVNWFRQGGRTSLVDEIRHSHGLGPRPVPRAPVRPDEDPGQGFFDLIGRGR